MRINWIKQQNNTRLIIIALGWGASSEVIGNQLFPEGFDIVALCDYRDLSYAVQDLDLSKYEDKRLIAWSFGVWASEKLFANQQFTQAIAIAGSPYPIDRKNGIDPRPFAITVRAIQNDGVVKFIVRMCGKHLREYLKRHSTRDLTEIQEELSILQTGAQVPYTPTINWTQAIIPADDIIFPPKALEHYWQTTSTPIEILADVPHYPFYDKEFILCRIRH